MTEVETSSEVIAAIDHAVIVALQEDLGDIDIENDFTTRLVVAENRWGEASLWAKEDGVICGLRALNSAFSKLDDRITVTPHKRDGDRVSNGDLVATVEGPVRPILVGERTVLNLIGHLSGIATAVRHFVDVAPNVELTDTRKTLPGLRTVQKYAVRMGGGSNHRFSLFDGILIKDNHIKALGSVGEAVRLARAGTSLPVQAECTTPAEVDEALDAGAVALLLDNRGADELKAMVEHIKARAPHVLVEASGGVTIDNVAEVASTGVDRVSVGAFTHSSPGLDVSLKLTKVWEATSDARSAALSESGEA